MSENDALREVLLPKLEGIRKSGGSWMARCPAHDDGKASLSITEGKTQPIVLKCHAGCDPVDILGALGLTWDDLCKPREQQETRGEWTPRGEAVAVYDYKDEAGKLLFQVLRTADKQFSQRVPDATRKTGWRWSLAETRRVPYRLPELIEAVRNGEIIYIAEGEKDVHALERAGVTATCNPGGAGKWRPEYAEFLRDVIVVVIADADKPGRAHARQVAASLEGIAAGVEIAEAAAGKDAADHLAAGNAVADFVITKDASVVAEPELAPDLHEFIAESDPAEVWVIPHLLERGDRLIWTGEEGLGKSMVSRQLAIGAAAGVHPFTDILFPSQKVLFIDCENPKRKSRRRFRELAEKAANKRCPVPHGTLRIIHRPEGVDLSREEERDWLIERVTAHKPDLLVIGPLYKLHALDINEEKNARVIVGVLDQARAVNDCALIVEAHAPHGAEGSRALRPVGSSLFLRWPEFGYGIRRGGDCPQHGKPDRHAVKVGAWRGPREEREWPQQLAWGTADWDWPWVPVDSKGDGDGWSPTIVADAG